MWTSALVASTAKDHLPSCALTLSVAMSVSVPQDIVLHGTSGTRMQILPKRNFTASTLTSAVNRCTSVHTSVAMCPAATNVTALSSTI
uniref:Putative secreted protein n=1 Tax=Anopheles marajoara TaxID=58244 RepID=A0A2M4CA98_9DIPT